MSASLRRRVERLEAEVLSAKGSGAFMVMNFYGKHISNQDQLMTLSKQWPDSGVLRVEIPARAGSRRR
ncbi:MAG: hypothetical protein HOL17_06230 [Gammaproteobacteria bacterium]|mgnify:CR=1 FL=1|jgi:hypothetical protein|nr:hypothetical protein [Gammaproteobacteria bacterium]MBT4606027.1 hypothetical protein [Thiotrichales bacterium]MBT7829778.1 hypothetical protein [Candidatus Neomarinimicrobiota bacterium]MBT4329541.1 hypothetical protein [Gammaproteobacteria bacterium]MBT5371304.1 hypothetical protein [Gammaproteobacteria bacterium]